MKIKSILLFITSLMIIHFSLNAQIENVPVVNPVYDFLLRLETKGLLPHYSLSQIPLQKRQIVSALELARENDSLLSDNEKKILNSFEREFDIIPSNRAVLFYSVADTTQIISDKIISDYEKSIYHYSDSTNNVDIKPLASLEIISSGDKFPPIDNKLLMGTLGFRINGTLGFDNSLNQKQRNGFGYYLQITNTAMLSGDSSLALLANKYANSQKFTKYHSDADISESHIAFQKDWFYASIGRQTRLFGAGLHQKLLINDWAPTFDALTLSAKFKQFEYSFSHNSLLSLPITEQIVGANAVIPPKYMAFHSFTFLPEWGEISFFESVIYTRDLDLAYLNPLSFFKTLEHSQRDRDNAGMGVYATFRPLRNIQLKGTWFLDDIRISEIGKSYWSNKMAWNIAGITSFVKNLDIGIEYSCVEPYTFTHYNQQNANTNDSVLFSSYILPNSDRWNLYMQYWYGQRYPLKLNVYYTRHGNNIYDNSGNLLVNVGGDPLQTLRWTDEIKDSEIVSFLAGDLEKTLNIELSAGYEIIRGFNIGLLYNFSYKNTSSSGNSTLHYISAVLRLFDF